MERRRETLAVGESGYVRVAQCVDRDTVPLAAIRACEKGRIHERAAVGIDLRHEGFAVQEPDERWLERTARRWKVGGLGVAGHVRVARKIHRNARTGVELPSAQICGVHE